MSDYYNLSDDELLATNLELEPVDTDETQTNETTSDDSNDEVATELTDDTDSDTGDVVTETNNVDGDEVTQTQAEPTEASETDYQAFYQKLTKPFRANGREIVLDNPDDMITLMQKGANYSKKMEQLKPKMSLVKALEQHGLNDINELGYLLDLRNKNPEAIAKLIKEADIDLYSFDTDSAEGYTPKPIQVNETSAVEEVISELTSQTPSFSKVLDNIVSTWDNQSQAILAEQPDIIKALHYGVESGMYDKVMSVLERERLLGRNTNLNYLEHYSAIESQLLNNQDTSFTGSRPNQENNNNSDKKSKARATLGNNNNNNNNNPFNFDPLKVSDDELIKLMGQLEQ